MARPQPAPLDAVDAVAAPMLPIAHRVAPVEDDPKAQVLKRAVTASLTVGTPGNQGSPLVIRSSTGYFSAVSTAPPTPSSATSSQAVWQAAHSDASGKSTKVVASPLAASYPPGVGWTPVYAGGLEKKTIFLMPAAATPTSYLATGQAPSTPARAYPPGLGWTPVAAQGPGRLGFLAEAATDASPTAANPPTLVVLPSPKARLEEARLPSCDEVGDEADAPLERELLLFFREAAAAGTAGAPETPEAAGFMLPQPGWLRTEKHAAPEPSPAAAAHANGSAASKQGHKHGGQQQPKQHAPQAGAGAASPGEWYWQASTKTWVWRGAGPPPPTTAWSSDGASQAQGKQHGAGGGHAAGKGGAWQGGAHGGTSWSWGEGWKDGQNGWSSTQHWSWTKPE